jgi:hypothetical protein
MRRQVGNQIDGGIANLCACLWRGDNGEWVTRSVKEKPQAAKDEESV